MAVVLKQTLNAPYTLWVLNEAQQVEQTLRLDTLAEFPDALKSQPLTLLLDGSTVRLTSVNLPKMSMNELRQAVPFALEESLSEPIDQLYFAIGPAEDNTRPVMIINLQQWQQLFEQLKSYNLAAQCVLPDFLALPITESQWTISIDAQSSLVHTHALQGFSIDTPNLKTLLQLQMQSQLSPQILTIYHDNQDALVQSLKMLAPKVQIKEQPFVDCIDFTALINNPPFNALQGPYQLKRKQPKQKRYWHWCAGSIIALLAVIICGEIALLSYYKEKAHYFNQQITQVYQQIFPGAKTAVETRFRVTQALKKYSIGQNDFLRLADQVGTVLSQQKTITLNSLSYAQNQMTVTLTAEKLSALDQLINALNQAGLQVQQDQSQTVNKKIQAKLIIGFNS